MLKHLTLLLMLLCLAVAATAATSTAQPEDSNPDPWATFNRKMFSFDMTLDRYLLKPAAKGYKKATPGWGRAMVSNFFANLKDMRSALNALLQARFGQAGSNFSRVLINTSMGVGGLFDVASEAGLVSHDQDFGLTLARWGFPTGPYLVLPLFGPSTVRDGIGLIPGSYTWPPHYLRDDLTAYSVDALYGVSQRAGLLGFKKKIIGDKYIFIRNYYLQSRAKAAGKAPEQDTFGASLDSSDNTDDDDGW